MATIAGLAIKIQANFGNIVRDAQLVADNVNNLSRVVRQSAPSMQQLEIATGAAGTALETFTEMMNQPGIDASIIDQTEKSVNKLLDSIGTLGDKTSQQFSKLPPTFDSVNKALESTQKLMSFQDVVKNNPLIDNIDEINLAVGKMTTESGELLNRFAGSIKNVTPSVANLKTAIENMKNVQTAAANFRALGGDVQVADDAIRAAHGSITSIGQSIADGILDIKPGMEGVMKAQREVQRLKELIEATGTTNELAGALAQAETNVAELASRTAEAHTQMTMFQSVVFGMNNLPFQLLQDLLKSIAGTIQKMFPISDQMKQLAAVLVSVVALIGLASTSTFSWAASQTYLNSLWKSNIIFVGLSSIVSLLSVGIIKFWLFITATDAATAAQWTLNTAMAANPIGLIVAAVAVILATLIAIVVVVASLFWWFKSIETAAKEFEAETLRIETASSAIRDRVKETVDRYRELNNLTKQFHEQNLTGAEKYQQRLTQINEMLNARQIAQNAYNQLLLREVEIENLMLQTRDKTRLESLQKQLADFQSQRAELANTVNSAQAFTGADAVVARENARLDFVRNMFGNLLDTTQNAQQTYNNTLQNVAAQLNAGMIKESEAATIRANALENFKRDDVATQKMIQAKQDYANTLEKYRDAAKSPLQKFDELKTALDKFKTDLTANEYNTLLGGLNNDLANQLGISDYLKPADSLEQTQKSLATALYKIQTYYESGAISMREMLAAQNRATESFRQQGEMGALLKKAQDAMIPEMDRIAKTMKDIDAYADAFAISDELRAKMKELANPDGVKVDEGKKDTAAIERGTAAYFAVINKSNDPQLKESQKQTKILDSIAKNTKPLPTQNAEFVTIG